MVHLWCCWNPTNFDFQPKMRQSFLKIIIIILLKALFFFIQNPFLYFQLQDEFLDVIYWLRQIIAVILGVIWGVAPLKGFLGIAM